MLGVRMLSSVSTDLRSRTLSLRCCADCRRCAPSDGSPVGEQGARQSRHTRYSFEKGEFSYTIASMLATALPRRGLPTQVDGSLMVTRYSFFTGQTAGGVATNQVMLDVIVFNSRGVWVDTSGKHTQVVCGHVAIELQFENWHMCGQSPYAQDGCARGEEGAMLDFQVRLINVHNFAPLPAVNEGYQSPRLDVVHSNNSLSTPPPRAVRFDTNFATANILVPGDVYVQRNLWTARGSIEDGQGLLDASGNLLLNMWCRHYITDTKNNQPNEKRLKALQKCREQDCQQETQCNVFYCPKCKFTNAYGFCYTLQGQVVCACMRACTIVKCAWMLACMTLRDFGIITQRS